MKCSALLLLFLTTITKCYCQFAEFKDSTKLKWNIACPSCTNLNSKANIVYMTASNIGLCKRIYPKYSCRGKLLDSNFTIIENVFPQFKRTRLGSKIATFEFGDIVITVKIKIIKHVEGDFKTDNISNCYTEIGGLSPKRKKTYEFVKIKTRDGSVCLPREAFHYFVQPNIDLIKCYCNENESKIYITGFDGDGGETLHFLWLIKDGKYIDRVLSGGN